MKSRLSFCDNLRVSQRNSKVIIGNRDNGEWMKLTEECYLIFKHAIDKSESRQELLGRLYDKEDREYMNDLLNRLVSLNIIIDDVDNNRTQKYIDKVTFSITERCNLICKHCSVSAKNSALETLSTLEVYKIMDKIMECNPATLIITGGEPLIRNDFNAIIKYLKDNFNGSLQLMTNGTLISESNAKFIAETFDQIAISMDGYNEETCSTIRGAGVFDQVIQGIKLLQRYGNKKISLSMIISKYTNKYIDEFNQLNKSLGTVSVLRKYAPAGRGFINKEELMDLESIESQIVTIDQTMEETSRACMNSSSSTGKYTTICSALRTQFCIGSDGYIYPCPALQFNEFKIEHLDNIVNLKFYIQNGLYKKTSGFQMYQSILPENYGKCMNCSVNMFCSGCPVYVYMYDKSGILDYFCHQKKMEKELLIWN